MPPARPRRPSTRHWQYHAPTVQWEVKTRSDCREGDAAYRRALAEKMGLDFPDPDQEPDAAPEPVKVIPRPAPLPGDERLPTLQEIAEHVAWLYGIGVADMRGKGRTRDVVEARNHAFYLARRRTGKPYARIGEYFGGRDHTTVIHGIRKHIAMKQKQREGQDGPGTVDG
ncbi:MAG: hypothetical protein D6773_17275 [Alphaproteobacteria bacterium]|nr:MAG: hypothetical protein D6773_17275 [Alphaproteobacteria bacterium]